MPEHWENDWLGAKPVFYNSETGEVSACINDVIDFRALKFDRDGLTDFLDFGYCVFGRTPVAGVHFLRPSHRLCRTPTGLVETKLSDPAENTEKYRKQESALIDHFVSRVRAWESEQTSEIVLPLSGGFDSRLLASALSRPSNARAFTYGLCRPSFLSHECALARRTASKLGMPWDEIQLDDSFGYIPKWWEMFGFSTHMHGMYHFEFYQKILSVSAGLGSPLLSGIIGDLWAGNASYRQIDDPAQLSTLGYTHGLDASRAPCHLKVKESRWRAEYWASERLALADPVRQAVELVRHKMMLLRYLVDVPGSLGFRPWGPFLSPDLALPMLMLPSHRRNNRQWQRDWLARLELRDSPPWWASRKNNLDKVAYYNNPPSPLDANTLAELFPKAYIERLNASLNRSMLLHPLDSMDVYGIRARISRRLGISDDFNEAQGPFLTIKALEMLISRRNEA